MSKHQHPASLAIFFTTEMWERYGFYVVQTLLALYLALHFHWPDAKVYALVGSFTALTYISPVLGGWIADHLIGQKRSILLGLGFLFTSYLLLGFCSSNHVLTFSLAGIAVGTGLLKSNLSSLLGNEYPLNSSSRESGFTIFYMGITAGIILGTTIPNLLNSHFGWSTPFLSATLGIFLACSIFIWGVIRYQIQDVHPYVFSFKKCVQATLLIFSMWIIAYTILTFSNLANGAFILAIILSMLYLSFCIYTESPLQAKKTAVIALLCIISAIFWAFYFQMFLSLTLFIVRVAQPTLAGIAFPPPYYVAIQSLGMMVIGYFLARKKSTVNEQQQTIQTGNKFLLSLGLVTFAYGFLAVLMKFNLESTALLSPLWIIPTYLLFSLAEILLSPVGLCAVTLLASRKKVSTMMGIFFVSLGIGGFLSGKLAQLTAIPSEEMSLLALKTHYAASFTCLFQILCGAFIFATVLNYLIKYLVRRYFHKETQ
jgi:POT family proton-dependent oligopeptide transporter